MAWINAPLTVLIAASLLAASLEMLMSKRDSNPAKKHGNMPL